MSDVTRSEQATVSFFDGLTVDGYRMPSGKFRVGIVGASLVLGYAENWLPRNLRNKNGKPMKTLRGFGFSENIVKTVSETTRGDREAQTISLEDFNRLIVYGVQNKKKAALALQLSLTKVALNDFFRDAFGEPPLSIKEKRELFYATYAASISPDGWREMDRQEIIELALAGDEEHMKWGQWNR